MNSQEILNLCFEKGLLIDDEILRLFSELDEESVGIFIEKVKTLRQRIITKKILDKNKEKMNELFLALPEENQKKFEKFKIKFGLNIEISREIKIEETKKEEGMQDVKSSVRFISAQVPNNKPEVKDFVKHFRNRFLEMKKILETRNELKNLRSIDKVSGSRGEFSLIGLVSNKITTKNNNFLIEIEDLTGKTRLLIGNKKSELYAKAEEISLDSVLGFKGFGNNEIIFVNEIIFPESLLQERKKSPIEEYVLFIGDLHCGSKLFLEKNFLNFIDFLNDKNNPEAGKIKYLFVLGDVVSGVGNYPGQEKDLEIVDLEKQLGKLAQLLGKIRKDIAIIISSGNHDGIRLMEPQPEIDKKYAWPLYELENVTFTGNPAFVNIGAGENFSGFDVLTYHGTSYIYYANNIRHLISSKAMNSPTKIMKYLLKNRHLAPTHTSVQYFPLEDDVLMIKKIPDIFVSGHLHKSEISYYNNILLISNSSWESITPYEEKMGSNPDFCKVPMFNLKTREIKILDFE